MPKELTLDQTAEFINALLAEYDHVGVNRIVTSQMRFSDPGSSSIPIYSANTSPDTYIQLFLSQGTGAFTLYARNLMFAVREMDNGNGGYIYRFEAGDDIHFVLVAMNKKPPRSPLLRFMGS